MKKSHLKDEDIATLITFTSHTLTRHHDPQDDTSHCCQALDQLRNNVGHLYALITKWQEDPSLHNQIQLLNHLKQSQKSLYDHAAKITQVPMWTLSARIAGHTSKYYVPIDQSAETLRSGLTEMGFEITERPTQVLVHPADLPRDQTKYNGINYWITHENTRS